MHCHSSPWYTFLTKKMSLLKRELKWHCTTDEEFLTLFDSKLSLPQQNSWTLCHLPKEMCSKVILVVVTQHSEKEERQQLTSKKTSTGKSGVHMQNLWEWTPLAGRSILTPTPTKSSTCRIFWLSKNWLLRLWPRDRIWIGLFSLDSYWPVNFHIPWQVKPSKMDGKLLHPLQRILDGFKKWDKPTTKKLPVE